MRYSVSVILLCILAIVLFSAGCAGDVNVKKKVGDFGSTFGASTEEQNALNWFTQKYGDPTVNSGQPPQFVEPLITSGLTANLMPVDKITVFPVNGGSVYFWVFYQHFKKGVPITVTWTYVENGKVVSTVNEQTGDTYGRFIVEFQKPDSGWGKGRQQITISGSGASTSVDFTIGDSLQTVSLPYTGTGTTTTSQPRTVTTTPRTVTTVTTKTSSAAPSTTVPSGSTSGLNSGSVWIVKEYGTMGNYDGVWTRRPGTDTFDATWNGGGNQEINIVSVKGDQITLYRPWNKGYYTGTISSDGKSIAGKGSWYTSGETWTVSITSGTAASGSTGVTSTVTPTKTPSTPTSSYIYVLKDVTPTGPNHGMLHFPTKDNPIYDQGYTKWDVFSSGTASLEENSFYTADPKKFYSKFFYTWAVPPSTLVPGGTVERSGTTTLLERSDSSYCASGLDLKGQIGDPPSHGQLRSGGSTDRSCQIGDTKTLSVITDVPSAREDSFKSQTPFTLWYDGHWGNIRYDYVLQRA